MCLLQVNASYSISLRTGPLVQFSQNFDLCLQHPSCPLCTLHLREIWGDMSTQWVFKMCILVSLLRSHDRFFDLLDVNKLCTIVHRYLCTIVHSLFTSIRSRRVEVSCSDGDAI